MTEPEPGDREEILTDPRVVTCTWCGCVVDDIRVGHCDEPALVDPPWNPDSTDLADFGGTPGSVPWYDAQERDREDGVE